MKLLYSILDFFYDIYFSLTGLLRGTYTEKILSNTWVLFTGLWYYVLLGVFAAAIIAQLMSNAKIRKFLTRRGGAPIVIASVLGILSPMCSFAVIPLAGGLLAAGVPLAPLMAFMIASPLMNSSLFIITWGVMGPEMALARTFSALFLGILGGAVVELVLAWGWSKIDTPLRSSFSVHDTPASCGVSSDPAPMRKQVRDFLLHSFRMTIFISKYFILALFLAGAVQALVDPSWIAALLGGGGTVALIGVLVGMGMGQGAALACFITGPATKISTLVALNAVLRKRVAALYLAVSILGGVLIGYGYSKIAPELKLSSEYYGKVESKDDAIMYKKGIGSPTGD